MSIRAYQIGVVLIDVDMRITFDPLCEFAAGIEHVHVTIRDGTITAAPMRQAGLSFDGMLIEIEHVRFPFAQAPGQIIEPVWVDASREPA